MDTLVGLGLSLFEAENLRAIKHPWIPYFKVTRCHTIDIKKIREHELPRLEAMVEIHLHSNYRSHPHQNPSTPSLFFERLAWKWN